MCIFFLETNLLSPDVGLVFWTAIAFFIFLFLLSRYAFKPMLNAVRKREEGIQKSLEDAKKVQEQLAFSQREYDRLVQQAQEEGRSIVQEANHLHNQIVGQAKEEAQAVAEKILRDARQQQQLLRDQLRAELKKDVVELVIAVSERVLRDQLSDASRKQQYVEKLLADFQSPAACGQ